MVCREIFPLCAVVLKKPSVIWINFQEKQFCKIMSSRSWDNSVFKVASLISICRWPGNSSRSRIGFCLTLDYDVGERTPSSPCSTESVGVPISLLCASYPFDSNVGSTSTIPKVICKASLSKEIDWSENSSGSVSSSENISCTYAIKSEPFEELSNSFYALNALQSVPASRRKIIDKYQSRASSTRSCPCLFVAACMPRLIRPWSDSSGGSPTKISKDRISLTKNSSVTRISSKEIFMPATAPKESVTSPFATVIVFEIL